MSRLGDVLAEMFRLKAVLIRLKLGLYVAVVWAIIAMVCLVGRIAVTYYLLKFINAPMWLWLTFWLLIPLGLIVDQIEQKARGQNEF